MGDEHGDVGRLCRDIVPVFAVSEGKATREQMIELTNTQAIVKMVILLTAGYSVGIATGWWLVGRE